MDAARDPLHRQRVERRLFDAGDDWTSTLPVENRSYFYPSVSGSFVFTQMLQDMGVMDDSIFSFGKLRASWAQVGKDTGVYSVPVRVASVGLTV